MANDSDFWSDREGEYGNAERLTAQEIAEAVTRTRRTVGRDILLVERQAAEKVREQRVASGLSQAELATRMTEMGFAMDQAKVSKLEKGQRPLRLAELYAVAVVLAVPPLTFLVGPSMRDVLGDELAESERNLEEAEQRRREHLELLLERVKQDAKFYAESEADVFWLSGVMRRAGAEATKGTDAAPA